MKNQRESLGEWIIGTVKDVFVVTPLQRFLKSKYQSKFSDEINYLPKGTVGRDLFELLKTHNFELIPHYESHDLKHLLLGYGMSTIEEIKMQTFLWGNGNKSFLCLAFVSTAIILPRKWKMLKAEYHRGKITESIIGLKLEDCMEMETCELQLKFQTSFEVDNNYCTFSA